jgi:phage internal scaffolding protein
MIMKVIDKRPNGTLRVKWMPEGESKTQQNFKKTCDVNAILARYSKTGVLDHVRSVQGSYGDFSNVGGYQEALMRVQAAQQAFDALPAKIRKRFDNNPEELLAFVSDRKNMKEAVSLGLIEMVEDKGAPVGEPAPSGAGGEPPSQPAS